MSLVSKRGTVGLVGACLISVLASSASAQQRVSSQATNDIANKRRSIPANLANQYFQNPETPAPRPGKNGGAYQHFHGTSGQSGAIYWTATTQAHYIYGDILEFFEENGVEEHLGYPTTDPRQGVGPGCASGTVMYQTFSLVGAAAGGSRTSTQSTTLCLRSNGKVERTIVILSTGGADVTGVSRSDHSDAGRAPAGPEREDDGRWPDDDDDGFLTPNAPSSGSGRGRTPTTPSRSR